MNQYTIAIAIKGRMKAGVENTTTPSEAATASIVCRK
jgi:hypothetical protein